MAGGRTITNGPEGGYGDDEEPWEFKKPRSVDVRDEDECDEGVGESLVKDVPDHGPAGRDIDREGAECDNDPVKELEAMLPAQVDPETLSPDEAGRVAVVGGGGDGPAVVTDPASEGDHPDDVLTLQRQAAAFKRLLREELKRQGVSAESLATMIAEGMQAIDARTGYPNHRMRMKYADMALRILGTAPAVALKATSYNFPGHAVPGQPSWSQAGGPGGPAQRALACLPKVDLSDPNALAEVQQALDRAKRAKKKLEDAAVDAKAAAELVIQETTAPKEPEE